MRVAGPYWLLYFCLVALAWVWTVWQRLSRRQRAASDSGSRLFRQEQPRIEIGIDMKRPQAALCQPAQVLERVLCVAEVGYKA